MTRKVSAFLFLLASQPLVADQWLLKDYGTMEQMVAVLPVEVRSDALVNHLTALFGSYDALSGVAAEESKLWLLCKDGSRHLYDDGKEKSTDQRIDDADVEDMFFWKYPLAQVDRMKAGVDPGRARAESLFLALYGSTAAEVEANLVAVNFAGARIRFNKLYGAADALEKAGRELEVLAEGKPEVKEYLKNLGGSFNWRVISGTKRLSTHSFGIAIDLNVKKSKYWKWEEADTLATFSRKDFPAAIVEIFERHGFVWGGKWYHYDTMHFEYRPEILRYARGNVEIAE